MQMAATKVWTLEELHSLPDDGNKYELINGELFVTPARTFDHETIVARLTHILVPFVQSEGLGLVYGSKSIIRVDGSEVAPDLTVRPAQKKRSDGWEGAPLPILVVEVLSPSTAQRDRTVKREHYRNVGIEEYWIADPDTDSITVFRKGVKIAVESKLMTWAPSQTSNTLRIDVPMIFARQ